MDQGIIDNEEGAVTSNEGSIGVLELEESESGHEWDDEEEKDSLLRKTEHHAAQLSPLRFLQSIPFLGRWSPSHGMLKGFFLLCLLIIVVYLMNGWHLQLQQLDEDNKNITDTTDAAPPHLS
jgi:hypothetical protein